MLHKKNKQKILFFRESVFKIAEQIFNHPNKTFHIRGLEKETGLSTTAVIKTINEFKDIEDLQNYGIITVEKTNLTTNIKANMESEAYKFYKTVFNLYKLNRYLFIDNLVREFNNPEAIVLFGSFAKGEDIEESDVDILIITKTKKEVKMIDVMEKELNRKINIHILDSLDKSSKEFKNSVANGVVLHGYLKVV